MAILKIKDENGKWVAVPVVSGSIEKVEILLQDILEAIQTGGTTSSTIEEIEQLIVSYFENKTVGEVEA